MCLNNANFKKAKHWFFSNFRPVSNLSFTSKILEKVVLVQLQVFLRSNQIYEMFQSGFRKLHSTETALLQVYNDILMSTDAGNAVALILLDLSLAFDMVDHNLLLSRLKNCVGLRGTVLNWFQSFLTNRKFSVCTGQYTSSSAPLTCGVPPGFHSCSNFIHDLYVADGFYF